MGSLRTTVTAYQEGIADCANCGVPTLKVTAYNEHEVRVTLTGRDSEQAYGTFTPQQLYELATLSAQVLVAQSEARRARQP